MDRVTPKPKVPKAVTHAIPRWAQLCVDAGHHVTVADDRPGDCCEVFCSDCGRGSSITPIDPARARKAGRKRKA